MLAIVFKIKHEAPTSLFPLESMQSLRKDLKEDPG